MAPIENPLIDPPPPEVPLPRAPLVRVIAQLRFPLITSLEKRDFVAPFQEAIRRNYPVLRAEQVQDFILGPAGATPVAPQTVWRFSDVESQWRVSLAPEFIALETTAYSSRDDFLTRLQHVLNALDAHVEPKVIDRFGVRYIDRVTPPVVNDIARLVRAEVLGIAATPMAPGIQHLQTLSVFTVGDAQLFARWGQVPENSTVDPAAIEPIDEPSWILDLDMFKDGARPFDVDTLVSQARSYTERLYTFFRWAVTDEFLRRYGGAADESR